jgi:hypothetical protein
MMSLRKYLLLTYLFFALLKRGLTRTALSSCNHCGAAACSSGFSVIGQPWSRSCDNLSVNHSGVAIVAAPGLSLSPLPHGLPLSSFEASACLVSSGRCRVTIAVVYQPGSHAVTSAFFDDLAAFLERPAALSLPIFIAGDLNVNIDCSDDHHSLGAAKVGVLSVRPSCK